MKEDIILSVRDLTKIYPGVVALDHVSIDFCRGEVHALCGGERRRKVNFYKIGGGSHYTHGGNNRD